MASGTINGSTNNSEWTFKIVWSESDVSVANNTSKVTATIYLGRANSRSYVGGDYSATISINGSSGTYSGNIPYPTYINKGEWIALKSRTVTVTHNNDGSKSCAISATMSSNDFTPSYCSASKDVTLDKIARTPSAPTSFTIGAGFGNYVGLGDTVTLNWSGASGVITGYEIQYSRGNSGWKGHPSLDITSNKTSGSTTDSFTATDIDVNGAGKAVKYRIRALNGSLASAWKESNTLTMMGGMDLKVSNAWKTGSVWIKVNNEWKRAKRVWINVNGTWKYSI